MQVVLTLCCLVPCSNFKNSDNCLTHFAQSSQEKEQQNSSSYVHLFLFFPQKVHLQELKVIMKRRNYARLHSFLIATVSGLKKDYPVFSLKLEFQFGDTLQHALSILNGKPIAEIGFACFQVGTALNPHFQSLLLPVPRKEHHGAPKNRRSFLTSSFSFLPYS